MPGPMQLNPDKVQKLLALEADGKIPAEFAADLKALRAQKLIPPPLLSVPDDTRGQLALDPQIGGVYTGFGAPPKQTKALPATQPAPADIPETNKDWWVDKAAGVGRAVKDAALDPTNAAALATGYATRAAGPLVGVPATAAAAGGVEAGKQLFKRMSDPEEMRKPITNTIPDIGEAFLTGAAQGAGGELLSRGFLRARAPFADSMTTRGAQVAERFKPDPGMARTSVTPAEVTESGLANWFENAGRHSLAGGGPFHAADESARKVVVREANKELSNVGARGIPVDPVAAKLGTAEQLPITGQVLQGANITGRAAKQKAAQDMYEQAFKLADEAGVGMERETGKTAAAADYLKPEFQQLSTMKKLTGNMRDVLGRKDPTVLDAADDIAVRKNAIAGATSADMPSMEEFTTPKPVTERVNLKTLHEEQADLGAQWRDAKAAAKRDPNQWGAAKEIRDAYQAKKAQIDELLSAPGNEDVAAKYADAQQQWKQMRRVHDNNAMTRIAGMRPDDIVPALISGNIAPVESEVGITGARDLMPGKVQLNKNQLVRQVLKAAPEAQDTVRQGVMRKLLTDSIDPGSKSIYGPELMKSLTAHSETLRGLLGNEHYQNLREFAELLSYKQRSRPDIGRMFIEMRTPGAVVELMKGKASVMNSVLLGVPAMMSRVMTNPDALKWLTEGLRTSNGMHMGTRALAQLGATMAKKGVAHDEPDSNEPDSDADDTGIPEPPVRGAR